MAIIFQSCNKLEYLDLSNFNTSNVLDISLMFFGCYELKEIKGIDKFKTDKVKDMPFMFSHCYKLEYLDLSNFNISNSTNTSNMFFLCNKSIKIKGGEKFQLKNLLDFDSLIIY